MVYSFGNIGSSGFGLIMAFVFRNFKSVGSMLYAGLNLALGTIFILDGMTR